MEKRGAGEPQHSTGVKGRIIDWVISVRNKLEVQNSLKRLARLFFSELQKCIVDFLPSSYSCTLMPSPAHIEHVAPDK